MKRETQNRVVATVQYALGIYLIVLSLLLAFHPRAIESFARTGYPDWIRALLAWSEAITAALFLVPRAFWVGAWSLLVVLLGAAGLHIVLGENPALLIVYMAIIAAIMVHRRGGNRSAGAAAGAE
jgi:hypothetical protein